MPLAFTSWELRELSAPAELAERRALLESRGLSEPGHEDLVLGFYEGDRLVATGSLVGDIVEGLAVALPAEGEGAGAALVTALIKAGVERGLRRLFIYTKPEEAFRFEAMGFRLLASVRLAEAGEGLGEPGRGAALLEWGPEGIDAWKASLAAAVRGKPEGAGAAVMNCNPFTLGHRYLVEKAAAAVPWLYVLVVEEERSLFPFKTRFELVRRGTSDIPNLSVIPAGPYVISAATFPTYFSRPEPGKAEELAARLHAAVDLEIFRLHVGPALKARHRFVGTEPYCPATASYNSLMKTFLPVGEGGGLEVHEIPRLEIGGEAVSASRVRELIRQGLLEEARPLLPESTWSWLVSAEAAPILERIRRSDSRH